MKTYALFFTIVLVCLVSINSFALEDLQCSNADGNLKRVEEEIWGANKIKWVIGDRDVTVFNEKFDKKTKVILDSKRSQVSRDEIYAIHVTVHSTALGLPTKPTLQNSDYVICRYHWDSRQD